ncbi:hypothetical protein D1B31_05895 [Neobacillus notoginsengisoli]|uniref:Uncharacterized protein n=1 Tax=Neobacillus notoginsengisoli TaxID=1578198 RepID=A0A417YXP0_9BACI|nr:hypothetical protein [Neobacillus notoginsengisoli]RHW42165.1 hypothetical protein D1B31_05895 [Neobacillus notoginsengisoli]
METVILVTYKIPGIPMPIKIASTIEPNKEQIHNKLLELMEENHINGDIQFRKLLVEKENSMYIFELGEKRCMVLVERLEKIIEFDT